jgi:hypothetical protein
MEDKIPRLLSKEEMQLPDFTIKEVEELYVNDLKISDELYDTILRSDRSALITDIEKLFQHATDQFKIFSAKDVSNQNTFFVWHAVFILRDLKATEALPALFNFLRYDEDITGFYLGDGLVEFGWQIFYSLGNTNLPLLVDFFKNYKEEYFVRSEILETFKQTIFHHPERQAEVEGHLRELLLFVSTVSFEDDFYIDELSESLLEILGQLQLTNLFPDVKRLLNEEKLSLLTQISWKDFERLYVSGKQVHNLDRQEFKTRKEIYDEYILAAETADDEDEDGDFDEEDFGDEDFESYLNSLDEEDTVEDSPKVQDDDYTENFEEAKDKSYIDYQDVQTPYVKKEPDVGRNDPCPCGSGKKYKKCHGKT